jgi:hypothetical protein
MLFIDSWYLKPDIAGYGLHGGNIFTTRSGSFGSLQPNTYRDVKQSLTTYLLLMQSCRMRGALP